MHFRDRAAAGQELAQALSEFAGRRDVVLMALPRGGVPVAAEVARALALRLDVIPVRKLGVPGHEECAMGAIAQGDLYFLDQQVVSEQELTETQVDHVMAQEQAELQRRCRLYRSQRSIPDLSRHTVVVIDDGLATGATMRVAVAALEQAHSHEIVVAVPVGETETCREIETIVGRLICPHQLSPFYSVGSWYDDFSQVTDAEVVKMLHR